MRKLFQKTILIVIVMSLTQVVFSQSVGINTTGATPATTNLLEVLQPSTTANSIGVFSLHNGAITGTGYGLWSEKTGGSTTNIAGYFRSAGATNNYALRLAGSTSGTLDISPAAATTSYSLTMPGTAAAANGAVFTSTTAGAASWTSVLPIANGGTNLSAIGANGTMLYSDGTNYNVLASSTAGYVLTTNAAAAPTWVNPATLGVKWNAIVNPDGNASLTHGAYTTAFTFNGVTAATAFGISSSGITTGKLFDLSSTAALTSGSVLSLAGNNTTAANFTGNVLYATTAGTAPSNGYVRFNFSGAHSGNGVQIDDVTATGNVMGITANALTSGSAVAVATSSSITGNVISVTASNASFTGNGIKSDMQGTTGATYAVWGQTASATGRGLYGNATSTTGVNFGVVGKTLSNGGFGVQGYNACTGAIAAGGAAGVYGQCDLDNGYGVWGVDKTTSSANGVSIGVLGETYSTIGAGVKGKATTATGVNYGVYGTAVSAAGFGLYTPDNAAARGYLLVGNPTAPASLTLNNNCKLMDANPVSGNGGTTVVSVCGSTPWYITASNPSYWYIDPPATRSVTRLLYSWLWVPTGATGLYADIMFSRDAGDDTYDGMIFEYTIDGTTYTKLTPTGGQAYSASLSGTSPTNCAVNYASTGWSAVLGISLSSFTPPGSLAGKWVRFSFTAMSDGGAVGGTFIVYGSSVSCTLPTTLYNGSFQNGSVYAEKNIYAGNNVLMGDVAEYFVVDDGIEAGELVSLGGEKANQYIKTKKVKDANVIGIVSTNPTVTINSPSNGAPVALTGRVPVKVTNEGGVIKIGDYLTASSTPGHAMKATGNCYAIGKAIEEFKGNSGKILCLIENGWVNLNTNNNCAQSGGSYFIPKGTKTVSVRDVSVNEKSHVFVSMLDNAGSNYWLSKKLDGVFEISLDKQVEKDISFDYFVDNAKTTQSTAVVIEKEENNSTANKAGETKIIDSKEYVEAILVPKALEDDLKVPPIPPDPTKPYRYIDGKIMEIMPSGK